MNMGGLWKSLLKRRRSKWALGLGFDGCTAGIMGKYAVWGIGKEWRKS